MAVIVGLFVAAVVASALVGWRFARESTPVTGPILLISIDPLRADRLSFYGGTAAVTPSLDRLAAEGAVFTQAYAHAASSLPAHLSLLTGQLPFDHGVRDDVGFTLDEDTPTLASRLASRGFDTGAAVSTYLLRPETGAGTGFADFDANRPDPPPDALLPVVERDSAATARAAVTWLDEQDSARFFYALQLNGASADLAPAAAAGDTDTALRDADAAVGEVLETLRRKGWYDDALVVVTSAYGGPPDGASQPGRGYTLDPPAMRVPFVVKMPGAADPQRIETPLQHIDLAPTVLDMVRAPGTGDLRGRSFRALLEGDDEAAPADTPRYAEAMAGALRHGWAELSEGSDAALRGSVAKVVPRIEGDAERDALALLGEIAPTLLPLSADANGATPDPRQMGPALARYRRAARLDAERQFAAAIDEYRHVVAAMPADAETWRRIGRAAARLGRVDDALAAFARVAALRPGDAVAAIDSARVETEAGRAESAAARLSAIAAPELASPALPPASRAAAHAMLAALAISRRDAVTARAQAALAEAALPGLPFTGFAEGRLLHDADQSEGAVAAFDEVLKALEEPTAVRAHPPAFFAGLQWYRGDSLARLDRHADALAAFEAAIAQDSYDVRAYISLATLQRATNRHEDAAATAERLLRAVPTPAGYAAAARLFTVLGDRERAAVVRGEAKTRFAAEPPARAIPAR